VRHEAVEASVVHHNGVAPAAITPHYRRMNKFNMSKHKAHWLCGQGGSCIRFFAIHIFWFGVSPKCGTSITASRSANACHTKKCDIARCDNEEQLSDR
jgi:hypothetical protein